MKNVEIFKTVYLKKKNYYVQGKWIRFISSALYTSHFIFEFTSVDDDGLASARGSFTWNILEPRGISREKKWKSSAPRALFTQPGSLLLIFG